MDSSSLILSQLWALPYFILYGIGILVAAIRWKRHPAVSLLAIGAFAILMAGIVFNLLFQIWRFSTLDDQPGVEAYKANLFKLLGKPGA